MQEWKEVRRERQLKLKAYHLLEKYTDTEKMPYAKYIKEEKPYEYKGVVKRKNEQTNI